MDNSSKLSSLNTQNSNSLTIQEFWLVSYYLNTYGTDIHTTVSEQKKNEKERSNLTTTSNFTVEYRNVEQRRNWFDTKWLRKCVGVPYYGSELIKRSHLTQEIKQIT